MLGSSYRILPSLALCALSLLSLLSLLCRPALAADTQREITLLFTNDFESAYDPIEAFWRDDMERIGGIAHMATLIDEIRAKRDPVLLLDAGDIFTGTLARRTEGAVSFDLMQLLGYDAMAIGNHEFEYGWQTLEREKHRAPFPVLGANLFYVGTEHPYAQPWTIVERGGLRVGLIGLMGQDAATALIPSNIAGVEVRDPIAVARHHADRLRPEVDLLVLLVHQGATAPMQTDDEADPQVYRGNAENLALASAVPKVDVIFAGHTDAGTESPIVHPETGALIMQTWGQGQHVGELRLRLDDEGAITSHAGRLIPVDADRYPAKPNVQERLDTWRALHPDLEETVGHTDSMLVRRYYEESALGNLFADIAKSAADAQIGLMPSGALRRDLPAGKVTRVELIDAFPFEDKLARMTLRGDVLLSILEQGFSLERGLLQVSGLRAAYDLQQPPGHRVHSVCVGSDALDPDAIYTVGTVEILAKGGDAYGQALEADEVKLQETRFADELERVFLGQEIVSKPALNRLYNTPQKALSCNE